MEAPFGMLGDPSRKRSATIRDLLVLVGLFALDFAAWARFPEVSFFALLGLVGLLGFLAVFYIPPPLDVVLFVMLGTGTVGLVAGLALAP